MQRSRYLTLRVVLVGILACTAPAYEGCRESGANSSSSIPPFFLYWSVAVSDLNGDAKPDVAASFTHILSADSQPGFAAVYLQDPAIPGAFLSPAIYSVAPTDVDPTQIAVGDLNGDGKADIVTANHTRGRNEVSTGISVFLQDPANPGHFLPPTIYETGQLPNAVAIGDLNGDGKPDLAVGVVNGVSVFLQDPAKPGSFLPPTTLGLGSLVSSVAIVDLNGDDKPDLVATAAASVVVLLQNPAMAGTFPNPMSYPAGEQPFSVAVADLNGDGKPDLAVANLGSPSDGSSASVSVLLQNPAAPGVFLTATNYKTDIRSSVVAIADLNGDGRADLAVANNGGSACTFNGCSSPGASISVLLQDPALPGQFQPTTNYAGTDQVLSVAIADMNGDNKPDLVIAQGGGIVIRFQDPVNPGKFLPITVITKQ